MIARLGTDGVAVHALDVATVAVKGLPSGLPLRQRHRRTSECHLFPEDSYGLRVVEPHQ
jgi:hypothetical protein